VWPLNVYDPVPVKSRTGDCTLSLYPHCDRRWRLLRESPDPTLMSASGRRVSSKILNQAHYDECVPGGTVASILSAEGGSFYEEAA
jgi:hypothetical protein